MAGHSKWANIKHRKQLEDSKRGKLFTRLIRGIKIAARLGGADPDLNPGLRNAIEAGRSANMTKDIIERAIKQGAGDQQGEDLEPLTYEGYGPGGVAILVECLSDNRNRTVSDVRHLLTKYDGSLGTAGSVAYIFSRKGILHLSKEVDENRLIELALEAGAEDVRNVDGEGFEVITSPEVFVAVKTQLQNAKMDITYSEVVMEPSTHVEVSGEDLENLIKMIDKLEELDDVQNVYTSALFPDPSEDS